MGRGMVALNSERKIEVPGFDNSNNKDVDAKLCLILRSFCFFSFLVLDRHAILNSSKRSTNLTKR